MDSLNALSAWIRPPLSSPWRGALRVVSALPLLVLWTVFFAFPAESSGQRATGLAQQPEKLSEVRARVWPRLEKDLSRSGFAAGDSVHLRVFKKERQLEVWLRKSGHARYTFFRTYRICSLSGEAGPKRSEGDHQAPEGFYRFDLSLLHPESRFHLAFNLGFPNAYDRAHGWTGSFLMIHGGCDSQGCFAMSDRRMEELYLLAESALQAGQPHIDVHIFPFRMTPESLERTRQSPWIAFWKNLAEGHDHFERTGIPPSVSLSEGRYVFSAAQTQD